MFYLDASQHMIAVQIRSGTTFEVTELKPLFDASTFVFDPFHHSYDLLPGGRFVFLRPRQSVRLAAPVLVRAESWFADVRARMKH